MEHYYVIKKNEKIVAIMTEKELLNQKHHAFLNDIHEHIEIKSISEEKAISLFREQKELCTDEKTRKQMEEKVFILEMVEKIKEQLFVEKDMDIILPEKAHYYLPQIEQELSKQGVKLSHPLRECIDDMDPLSKFSSKLEHDRKKNREVNLGRAREE